MKILPHLDSENIMLVNVNYHRGTKNTDYIDYLDIIYKELDTGEKFVETIEAPEMEVYFTKPEYRNYNYNKSFIELEQTYMKTFKFKDLEYEIAKEAGPQYVNYIKDCKQRKDHGRIRNIHKYKYVYGSDYDIENWYRIQWLLNNHNDKNKPITKQFLDIEVDSIDIEGFPKDGECPINAVTLVDEHSAMCFTFLLRNDKNPLIEKFEREVDAFIDKLHEAFDETYGELDYRIHMYDDERKLLIDVFKLINLLKRDFLLIWNMAFDIPYIISRIIELGMDPIDVICHKDFRIKELYYKKDTRNFKVENKGDFFKVSSYTIFFDQMILYAGLRKGRGELRSHALNAVAKEEIKDEKLDYSEDANIKTLPYIDYEKFVMYNIKDVLLQMGIERKTGDVDNVYQRSYTNATSYQKIFKQTVFLKNRAYVEYFKQGFIIGNNINVEYGMEQYDDSPIDNDDDEEKFDGALVADPTLNLPTGITIFGAKSSYIFDNVVDMDFSSMYPHIIIAFNIAPNCMIGKLLIDQKAGEIFKKYGNYEDDLGKEFVDNMLVKNYGNMGSKFFNLPGIQELDKLMKERFQINSKKKININKDIVNKYFLEKVNITI